MHSTLKEFYLTEIDRYFKNSRAAKAKLAPGDHFENLSLESVYLIYNPACNLYKIGITTSLKSRLSAICAATGCDCRYVYSVNMEGDYDEPSSITEKILHKYFDGERKNGEWFELSSEQANSICQLFRVDVGGFESEDLTEDHYNLLLANK